MAQYEVTHGDRSVTTVVRKRHKSRLVTFLLVCLAIGFLASAVGQTWAWVIFGLIVALALFGRIYLAMHKPAP